MEQVREWWCVSLDRCEQALLFSSVARRPAPLFFSCPVRLAERSWPPWILPKPPVVPPRELWILSPPATHSLLAKQQRKSSPQEVAVWPQVVSLPGEQRGVPCVPPPGFVELQEERLHRWQGLVVDLVRWSRALVPPCQILQLVPTEQKDKETV